MSVSMETVQMAKSRPKKDLPQEYLMLWFPQVLFTTVKHAYRVRTLFCEQNWRLFPDFFQTTFFIFQTQVTVRFFIAQLKRERNKPWCIANTMNHNAMQGIGDWALLQQLSDLNNLRLTATYYKVLCRLAKLIKVKSATLQRFQLAFKHLLLLEKNSRLHPIFQDFAFNFHTFSRSGKVVRKFPDFFKNSRLCTNAALTITPLHPLHIYHFKMLK